MDLGPSEVLLIFLVVMLLFGAKRLPEVARGTGRALRIFKAEVSASADEPAPAPVTVDPAPDHRAEPSAGPTGHQGSPGR